MHSSGTCILNSATLIPGTDDAGDQEQHDTELEAKSRPAQKGHVNPVEDARRDQVPFVLMTLRCTRCCVCSDVILWLC